MKSKTLIVNLYGGPGSGKSTTAAGVFHQLKLSGVNCEYAQEYAKDLTWEERVATLGNQPYIFGKQYQRLFRLLDKVDIIITDSPLLLSYYYDSVNPPSFKQSVIDIFNTMNNVNFFIERVKPYNPSGRNQTEELAKAVDWGIKKMLEVERVPFTSLPGDSDAVAKIIYDLTFGELRSILCV